MARPPDPARRAALLGAAADHVAAHGLGGLSLRPLAAAIGTSPRVLLYHFTSKEALVGEVLAELRRRAEPLDPEEALAAAGSTTALATRTWQTALRPDARPFLLLFFELYAAAVRAPEDHAGFLARVVDPWLAPVTASLERDGLPAGDAVAAATELIAVVNGLLVDLLATGDRERVDLAFHRHVGRLADDLAAAADGGAGAAVV